MQCCELLVWNMFSKLKEAHKSKIRLTHVWWTHIRIKAYFSYLISSLSHEDCPFSPSSITHLDSSKWPRGEGRHTSEEECESQASFRKPRWWPFFGQHLPRGGVYQWPSLLQLKTHESWGQAFLVATVVNFYIYGCVFLQSFIFVSTKFKSWFYFSPVFLGKLSAPAKPWWNWRRSQSPLGFLP